jgi:hypothetical protein
VEKLGFDFLEIFVLDVGGREHIIILSSLMELSYDGRT